MTWKLQIFRQPHGQNLDLQDGAGSGRGSRGTEGLGADDVRFFSLQSLIVMNPADPRSGEAAGGAEVPVR